MNCFNYSRYSLHQVSNTHSIAKGSDFQMPHTSRCRKQCEHIAVMVSVRNTRYKDQSAFPVKMIE